MTAPICGGRQREQLFIDAICEDVKVAYSPRWIETRYPHDGSTQLLGAHDLRGGVVTWDICRAIESCVEF